MVTMSQLHPLVAAPNYHKPYLRINYYDFQEWMQVIDDNQLTKYEMIRLKNQTEVYLYGRTLLQVPVSGCPTTRPG